MHHPDSKGNARELATIVCAVQYTLRSIGDTDTSPRRGAPDPIA
jgi:hypothetical protein